MNIVNPKGLKHSQDFLDAFHYTQRGTARRFQLGKLVFLHRDKKYYGSIKVAHEFADYYVDKALEYRRCQLKSNNLGIKNEPKNYDKSHRLVLVHAMGMENDNRKDLRNPILHGRWLKPFNSSDLSNKTDWDNISYRHTPSSNT
jgi:hypothetical protein